MSAPYDMHPPAPIHSDHLSGDYELWAEKRHATEREAIAEEYATAIAFAARIEALAKDADSMVGAIPANEYATYSQSRTTWRDIAACLRDVIDGQLLADEKSLETLADMRVTGEG